MSADNNIYWQNNFSFIKLLNTRYVQLTYTALTLYITEHILDVVDIAAYIAGRYSLIHELLITSTVLLNKQRYSDNIQYIYNIQYMLHVNSNLIAEKGGTVTRTETRLEAVVTYIQGSLSIKERGGEIAKAFRFFWQFGRYPGSEPSSEKFFILIMTMISGQYCKFYGQMIKISGRNTHFDHDHCRVSLYKLKYVE